jgi:hypothetical protein
MQGIGRNMPVKDLKAANIVPFVEEETDVQ